MWNRIATLHIQPAGAQTRGGQAALDRPHDQVLGGQRHLPGTLTLDLDDETGICCLNDDLVIQAQRQTEAVEARSEVGTGGRNDSTGP